MTLIKNVTVISAGGREVRDVSVGRDAREIDGTGKFLLPGLTVVHVPFRDAGVWEKVFQIAKEKDVPVVVHAESEALIQAGRRDCECARVATEAAIALREKVGNRLHIAHLSCKAELELVRAHKNPMLSCVVTPHHLLFTREDVKDGFLKVNPPLRSAEDAAALWEGLRDGTVDCLATDHAPHTKAEKNGANPPAGVP